ncbi:hypothetical protein VP01_915g9 [Puccinia sorghi]|uniref:Uncharacterized protein n=1 Tax=Puccinia sorghi TaxID=27349 RepID=A0A0L6U7G4_9BASI|nr:hypothetical protein VP01_915g9 [Puccinia sorghi]
MMGLNKMRPESRGHKYLLGIDQLTSQLAFLGQKRAREVAALNKEVSELESIIESQVFQEDELEEEIQRLKEQLSGPGAPMLMPTLHDQLRSIRLYSGGNGAELQRWNSMIGRRLRREEVRRRQALFPQKAASNSE